MGEAELRAALCQEAEARARTAWREAEEIVAARRRELEEERQRLQQHVDLQREGRRADLRARLVGQAEQQARRLRLTAEDAVSERFLEIARGLLKETVAKDRTLILERLLDELPDQSWTAVRVHPEDRETVARRFPGAVVTVDEALIGGAVVSSPDGRIEVDNSVAGRLERVWVEWQSALMTDLRREAGEDATSGA